MSTVSGGMSEERREKREASKLGEKAVWPWFSFFGTTTLIKDPRATAQAASCDQSAISEYRAVEDDMAKGRIERS